MKTYNDPLYGQIEIDDLVLEMVAKCPEQKRLRYVGMMNFKSLSMLGLTNMTRLVKIKDEQENYEVKSILLSCQKDLS